MKKHPTWWPDIRLMNIRPIAISPAFAAGEKDEPQNTWKVFVNNNKKTKFKTERYKFQKDAGDKKVNTLTTVWKHTYSMAQPKTRINQNHNKIQASCQNSTRTHQSTSINNKSILIYFSFRAAFVSNVTRKISKNEKTTELFWHQKTRKATFYLFKLNEQFFFQLKIFKTRMIWWKSEINPKNVTNNDKQAWHGISFLTRNNKAGVSNNVVYCNKSIV